MKCDAMAAPRCLLSLSHHIQSFFSPKFCFPILSCHSKLPTCHVVPNQRCFGTKSGGKTNWKSESLKASILSWFCILSNLTYPPPICISNPTDKLSGIDLNFPNGRGRSRRPEADMRMDNARRKREARAMIPQLTHQLLRLNSAGKAEEALAVAMQCLAYYSPAMGGSYEEDLNSETMDSDGIDLAFAHTKRAEFDPQVDSLARGSSERDALCKNLLNLWTQVLIAFSKADALVADGPAAVWHCMILHDVLKYAKADTFAAAAAAAVRHHDYRTASSVFLLAKSSTKAHTPNQSLLSSKMYTSLFSIASLGKYSSSRARRSRRNEEDDYLFPYSVLELLDDMKQEGISRTEEVHIAALKALCVSGSVSYFSPALRLITGDLIATHGQHEEEEEQPESTSDDANDEDDDCGDNIYGYNGPKSSKPFAFHAVANLLSSCSDLGVALQLFDMLKASRLCAMPVDTQCYNVLFEKCAAEGGSTVQDVAADLFEEMVENGSVASVATYDFLARLAAKNDDSDGCLEMMKLVCDLGGPPSHKTCEEALILFTQKRHDMERAFLMRERMRQYAIPLSDLDFGLLLSISAYWGDRESAMITFADIKDSGREGARQCFMAYRRFLQTRTSL